MIELHLVLKAPPNKTRTPIAALQALAKSARLAPGCIAVEVNKMAIESRTICYEETWGPEAGLR